MKPHLPYTYSTLTTFTYGTLTNKILPVIWEQLVETVEAEVGDLGLAEDVHYDVVRKTVRQLQKQIQLYKL